jgi:small-conductance mechanosensitive channel
MRSIQKIAAIGVVVLLGATVYGLVRTGQSPSIPTITNSPSGVPSGSAVDQTPLLTALGLAQMRTTAEELPFAQDALRIADKEMDLAYAAAERHLEEHPAPLSAEAKQIEARLKQAEDALAADDALVARLTAEEAKATGAKKDELGEELVLATAHREEHQDEVDDAKEDLARAGGDSSSRIQAMIEEHKASSQAVDNLKISASAVVEEPGLIHRFAEWWAWHQKQLLLWQAKQQAESSAASFSAAHKALEAQVDGKQQQMPPAAGPAAAATASSKESTLARLTPEQSAALKATKQRASDRKTLASLDKRIENQKELAGTYGNWIAVVAAQQRAVFHSALIGFAVILGIVLVGIFFDSWLERLLGKLSVDRRQVEMLRAVTRAAVRVVAFLAILLVIIGPPGQLGTFLGLAGAGLTVALKDFIVGFIGWFVLMGKNGIRVGDWVEINGVTGEVVEIGPIHTVLLETGNWTDSGHPTGRRVTFTNSFAIEGHYFNFSTSGQWLWDELQVVLPTERDPYPVVEQIHQKVLEATAESAKEAEAEWKRATRSREMSAFSAAPAINVKPVPGGIEVSVRYITRASERSRLRTRLYQAAVDLLGPKHEPPPARATARSAASD